MDEQPRRRLSLIMLVVILISIGSILLIDLLPLITPR
jgi:hypothetical protein